MEESGKCVFSLFTLALCIFIQTQGVQLVFHTQLDRELGVLRQYRILTITGFALALDVGVVLQHENLTANGLT